MDSHEVLLSGRLLPCLQKVEVNRCGKHSTLLRRGNDYCRNKFYNTRSMMSVFFGLIELAATVEINKLYDSFGANYDSFGVN